MIYVKMQETVIVDGVCAVLTREFDPGFIYTGESHPFAELFFVSDGEVEVVENDQTYMLGTGDLIIHAPGEFHRLRSAGGTAPRTITICFMSRGELPQRLTDGVLHPSSVMAEELAKATEMLHRALGNNFDGGEDYDEITVASSRDLDSAIADEAMLRLSAFLLSLRKLNISEGSLSRTESATLYREMVRTMNSKVRENLTLSELAAIHHISESYVKKLFRSYIGEAPSVYFSRLRINEAKKLLEMGMSIAEVAEEMSFSSAAYFSAYFKRLTGICAKEYRRKHFGSTV